MSIPPANSFKLCTLKTQKGTNPLYQDFTYTFTADGDVDLITDPINGNQDFGYDALDRLTTAAGPYGTGGAPDTITYTYNQIGNILTNSQLTAGTFTYPTSGAGAVRPHAVQTAGPYGYSYDNNGNQTGITSTLGDYSSSTTFNVDNRLASAVTTFGSTTINSTFVYDGEGQRVKKIVGTTTTRYISKLYECDTTGANTSCSRFIWANDTRIATVAVTSGAVHYWHGDHLGSSSVITDSTGAKVQALTYSPFGGPRTNQSFTTPAVDVPYKFTGKEFDYSTDFYYYESRYYDPWFGRFISPDPLVGRPGDPQDLNRYAYARNNPLIYTDPTGHFFKNLFKNPFLRALGWVVNPMMMQFLDPATQRHAISGTAAMAGFAAGGPVGMKYGYLAGGLVGGLVSGVTNVGASAAAGYKVDPGRMIAASAAAGLVTAGIGHHFNPIVTAAAGGATHAAVSGGDPARGAWMGAATAFGMAAVQYGFYAVTLPTYTGGTLPANSVGYVLPRDIKGALISLIDGGPFSHAVAIGNDGLPYGATPGGGTAVLDQGIAQGEFGSLFGRQILVVPGALSNAAGFFTMHSRQLNVNYSGLNIGSGMNCACFTSSLLRMSGQEVNSLSPSGQYYELKIYGH